MSDYPMLISNKLHSFRNFLLQNNSFSVLFFIYFLDTNVEGSTDGLLAY